MPRHQPLRRAVDLKGGITVSALRAAQSFADIDGRAVWSQPIEQSRDIQFHRMPARLADCQQANAQAFV